MFSSLTKIVGHDMGRPPGRPPLGKQAMSGAERQRRYLDRRLKVAQTDTALKAELAQARKRIAELEARAAELEAETGRLKAKATTGQAPPHDGAAGKRIAALEAEIAKLKAELQAKPVTVETAKIAALENKLSAVNEIANHFAQMIRGGLPPVTFTPKEYTLLIGCLHPDRVLDAAERKRYERAFLLFTDRLPEKFFVDKPKPQRPVPPPLPRTVEELMAAKFRKERESRAKRAAKAAERKAAKAAKRTT
jgi:uncharacterized small protein (DUF1192 family)